MPPNLNDMCRSHLCHFNMHLRHIFRLDSDVCVFSTQSLLETFVLDHSEAMSVVAFDEVPCWSTKTAKKQDEEPTKKSDSEGTQKEPKTAKKQDEEVLCCSYETCCTCGQEGLRREDAAAECRICGHLACTNWCILWRDRLGVLCRCCLGAQH